MKPHAEPTGRMAGIIADALGTRDWAQSRVLVSSFWHAELDAIRALMPELPLAVLYRDPGQEWAVTCDRLAAAAMHVRFDYLSSGLISAVRRRSMDIRTYTANDPEAAAPFRERGLTGVITDHPPFYLEREEWREWSAA